jgi:purine-binding chemotaxis protein CheW
MELSELEKKQEAINKQISTVGDGTIKTDDGEEVSEGQIVQLVTFNLDDVDYGVDILLVHEILRIPQITRLPNTPKFIKGVINLRGNVIPVVDIRARFGFKTVKLTDLSRIIVIEAESKQIGLLVDNVASVVRLKDTNVDPPSTFIEGISEEFITGVGRLKDKLVIILSLKNVLYTDEEIEERKTIAALKTAAN